MSDDPFEQLEQTARKILALIECLQADNKRLRAEVADLEEELKEIGAVSWRSPDPEDPEVKDPDLLREDAHERKRLEKEYPWKE